MKHPLLVVRITAVLPIPHLYNIWTSSFFPTSWSEFLLRIWKTFLYIRIINLSVKNAAEKRNVKYYSFCSSVRLNRMLWIYQRILELNPTTTEYEPSNHPVQCPSLNPSKGCSERLFVAQCLPIYSFFIVKYIICIECMLKSIYSNMQCLNKLVGRGSCRPEARSLLSSGGTKLRMMMMMMNSVWYKFVIFVRFS